VEGGEELLDSLRERVSGPIDRKRKGLHVHSLVGNSQDVAEVLAGEELPEGDNFLVHCSYVSNVHLPFFASFSRLEQVGSSQGVQLPKRSSILLEAAQHVRCNKFSEVSDVFARALVCLKHPHLLFERAGLLGAGKGGDHMLVGGGFEQHLDASHLLGTRSLFEGFEW